MRFLRLLLMPFAWLYGVGMAVRNFLFDRGILKSREFPVPVISVGNLTTGGTGKTPHVEYLVRLLKDRYTVATLSRGYGRKTKGYVLLTQHDARLYGDEPSQYHAKFPKVMVAVCEKRSEGIRKLLEENQKPQVVLLDDAYQHRAVKPGLNILLTDYDSLRKTDFVLPAGHLREWKSGARRADVIIISKSPEVLVPIERKAALNQLRPGKHQRVYFSFLRFGDILPFIEDPGLAFVNSKYYFENRYSILLITGIANPSHLIEYLRRKTDKLETMIFPDHHQFNRHDLEKIKSRFQNIFNSNKIILTTEKDMMRLNDSELKDEVSRLPFFYLPIQVAFHKSEEEGFDDVVEKYLKKK